MSKQKVLIDREEARAKFSKVLAYMGSDVDRILYNMPTIDAVPVVRCKDCHFCDPENHHCDHPMGTTIPVPRKPDDFCSYGERMDGDTDEQ